MFRELTKGVGVDVCEIFIVEQHRVGYSNLAVTIRFQCEESSWTDNKPLKKGQEVAMNVLRHVVTRKSHPREMKIC